MFIFRIPTAKNVQGPSRAQILSRVIKQESEPQRHHPFCQSCKDSIELREDTLKNAESVYSDADSGLFFSL